MVTINSITETDFQETDVGLIPIDWKCLPLSNVVSFTRKPRGLDLQEFDTIPFVPMALISEQDTFIRDFELRTPDEINSGTYCERGDLLIAKITPSFENGKQGILDNIPLEFGYATTEVYTMKPLPHIAHIMFLFGYFKLDRVRSDITGKMEGSTGRQRVPKSVIVNYPVPVPPLPEQKRIATVLNAIQDEIAAQEDLIRELREFKRSTMERLFTYGAGETPAETKVTEVGEIPTHWEVVTFENVEELLQYGTSQKCNYEPIGYPVIRIPNVLSGKIDPTDMKYTDMDTSTANNLMLEIGDLLFVRTNGNKEYSGRAAVYKGFPDNTLYASYLIRLRFKPKSLHPQFAEYYVSTDIGSSFLSGRSVKTADGKYNINMDIIRTTLAPKPPFDEQEEIVKHLMAIDEKIAVEEDRKTAMEDFFRSILQQLMTGQIRLLSDEGLPV